MMSSQDSTEDESILSKNIIVVGSMDDAKKLLGDKDKYVTREEYQKLECQLGVLGKKFNQLLYEFNFFKIKMVDTLKDISSREDDFVKRMTTELVLFKSEKAKSSERIRNSKNIYENQARKVSNPSKRQISASDSSASKRVKK